MGFRYLDLSGEDSARLMNEVSQYCVYKTAIERYSHDEYGDYETVASRKCFDLSEMRSPML